MKSFKRRAATGFVKIKIILADWAGYSLHREKTLGTLVFDCGLGLILENMARHRAGMDFEVVLVINEAGEEKKNQYFELARQYALIKKIIFRDNRGFDIGAYNCGYQYLRQIHYKGEVMFVNSSARGPRRRDWLFAYHQLFKSKKEMGLCGSSINSYGLPSDGEQKISPHVQSFVLYTSMKVLCQVFPEGLPGGEMTTTDKLELILGGEIEISRRILEKNYVISGLRQGIEHRKGAEWRCLHGDWRYHESYANYANFI